MIGLLLLTLGVAVGSALVPFINVELFVLGVVTAHATTGVSPWLLGAVVAIGQVAGKLLYFYAARGDLRLPEFLHRHTRKVTEPEALPPTSHGATQLTKRQTIWRWTLVKLAWLREKCHEHPKWMFGTHAFSSVTGIPPFMATTVLAGLAGMGLREFIIASLPGRYLRFVLIAASPHWFFHLGHWLHHT